MSATNNQPDSGNSPTTQPEDEALAHWQAAEKALQHVVVRKQIELLQARERLERMHGAEDPKESLLAITDAFPKGIPFPFIKSVFDVSFDLARARNELVKDGKITVDDKRRAMTLYPAKATTQASEATAQ